MKKCLKYAMVLSVVAIMLAVMPVCCFAASTALKAQNTYRKFLAKYESHFSADYDFSKINDESYKKCSSFITVDLDNDKIPELVTFHPIHYKNGVIYVYTYKNGKMKNVPVKGGGYGNSKYGVHVPTYTSMTSWWGLTCERCNNHHAHLHMMTMTGSIEKVIAIKNGEVVTVAQCDDESNIAGNCRYSVDGQSVSASTYNESLKNCSKKTSFLSNNADERKSYFDTLEITLNMNGGYFYGKKTVSGYLGDRKDTRYGDSFLNGYNYPYRKGYAFVGFCFDKAGKKPVGSTESAYKKAATKASGKLTIYAKWTKECYKVTLVPGEHGKIARDFKTKPDYPAYTYEKDVRYVRKGDLLSSGNPYMHVYPQADPGYEFDGWYSDKAFNNKIDIYTYRVNKKVTLYAKFRPA